MHFMLETIIAAHLLGVDPFDQPAVEEGKVLAKQYLNGLICYRSAPDDPGHRFASSHRRSELDESFVRSSGPGGQNVNKLSTAVQLRFDVRRSPSLPNDVALRLMRLAGRRLTKDGVLVIIAQSHRTQERNRAGGARPADRADPAGGGRAGPAPRHQADQGVEAEAARRQEAPRRHQGPAAEQAVV